MYCSLCGERSPDDAGVRFCRSCGADLLVGRIASAPLAEGPSAVAGASWVGPVPASVQITASPYGGFWVRLLANLIDSAILGSVTYTAALLVGFVTGAALAVGEASSNAAMLVGVLVGILVAFVVSVAYYVVLTPLAGATPGKLMLGYQIVGADGRRIGYGRAFVRFLSYAVSGLAFGLGYIWIGLDERKQGWHDKLAGTYVVRSAVVKS